MPAVSTRRAGKRGRLTAYPPRTVGTLRDYLVSPLPTPPASFDYASQVIGGVPMALNDQLGDCTIAGVVHLLQLAYATVRQPFTYPGDAAVERTYFGLTGGGDTGLVETTVLQAWTQTGLFGTKLAGWAPIDVRDEPLMAAACYAFGGLYLGFDLPATTPEAQFADHEWWSLEPGVHPPADGHCTVACGANRRGFDNLTWGAESGFTANFWRYYGATCYVVIPTVFQQVGHGPLASIDIASLQADLGRL